MNEILVPGIREKLWHSMRGDLTAYVPEFAHNALLMCPLCGRRLPQQDFGLEHIIPRQALKLDPVDVRNDPNRPANVRAKNLLLCNKTLVQKGIKALNNGCNSWKGRYFDGPITALLAKREVEGFSTDALIAAQVLAYLAMVQEFGYIAVLAASGKLMRRQFFSPHRFLPDIGTRHQVVLKGQPFEASDVPVWERPFTFKFEEGACFVTIRNFVVIAPASFDPAKPIAKTLIFVPQKHIMRPHFDTAFD